MNKENIYYVTNEGSNYKTQNSNGKDWMGFHYVALDRVKSFNKMYDNSYEAISVAEYEKRFGICT